MAERKLEIGPGVRLPGFEGVDILPNKHADKIADARKLPYPGNTFAVVYASHVIEHFPWYETVDVLKEWARVLAPKGSLEVWTVNAVLIAKAILDAEAGKAAIPDKWRRFNPESSPFLWCAGRLFAYSKSGEEEDENWHKALFTPNHLMACFTKAGLSNVRVMQRSELRGYDHGVINLGVRGTR